jgi:hypothetical protein
MTKTMRYKTFSRYVQIKNASFASLVYEEVLIEVKRTAIDNQDISGLQIWVAILAVKTIQKAYPKQMVC